MFTYLDYINRVIIKPSIMLQSIQMRINMNTQDKNREAIGESRYIILQRNQEPN